MTEIKVLIQKDMNENLAEGIEIGGIRIIKGMEYLSGASLTKVVLDGYAGQNKLRYMAFLRNSGEETRIAALEVSYDMLVDVLVTSRALARGVSVGEEDFYRVKQKRSKLPPGVIQERSEMEGKVLKTPLSDGTVLKTGYFIDPTAAKRGQRVKVLVEGASIIITTQGMLKSNTVLGGTARVVCDNSKKEIIGILIAPDIVRISL
jgi:flagella basal body P-ring formation protein FlgA